MRHIIAPLGRLTLHVSILTTRNVANALALFDSLFLKLI